MVHELVVRLLIEKANELQDEKKQHDRVITRLSDELKVTDPNDLKGRWIAKEIGKQQSYQELIETKYRMIADYLSKCGEDPAKPLTKDEEVLAFMEKKLKQEKGQLDEMISSREDFEKIMEKIISVRSMDRIIIDLEIM